VQLSHALYQQRRMLHFSLKDAQIIV